ncbi:hypothetical protein [Clostridium botulinum]|uniref:hypothetical protein n=1 Tax=Clostridium botulinum TaxID=1491 RepID=UPI001E2FBC11|nr:hypothetical protein [Clostridium botulinum]MCD3254354.1 hypothetical protein [Clostridium botulinum C/D]MCD3279854.1 hypothetical protein [Clostridium botulinum C/D]MCD3339585.1 hypothetical protein [Clostridium botulinum C/D]MCD3357493.1 hypothetical protein [Clostridium botulinum C/D]
MTNYRTNLNELELNRLNLIENKEIRNSCMSILSYLLKKHTEEIEQYAEAELTSLKNQFSFKISLRKFLEKYNRGHQAYKLSIKTLKLRMDLLQELKLITITKINNINSYFFNRFADGNKVGNKQGNNLNNVQTVDTTGVEAPQQEHKYLNTKINNKNNINNSVAPNTSTPKIFVSNIEEIKEQVNYQIAKFNIIHDFAIQETERRIKNAIKKQTLRFTGVEKYLRETLSSIKNQFIPQCFNKKYKSSIEQQDNTETVTIDTTTSVLEDVLRADKISKSNCNKIEYNKLDSFNNYEQRDYDFDELEKKLLGWV